MKRIHSIEIEDQAWCPRVIREAGMAYLRTVGRLAGQWRQMRPTIDSALERSGENALLDLCSGGGGPVLEIARSWHEEGRKVEVTLTDRYPDSGTCELAAASGIPGLRYDAQPLDATALPPGRPGLRTLFNGFHHQRPEEATALLASVVRDRQPIAVVEVIERSALAILSILFAGIFVLLTVPLMRPFRLLWIPLTYLVPVIPLFVTWDGVVSCLRIYTEDELLALAKRADPDDTFEWRFEKLAFPPLPVSGSAFVGIPRERLRV